MESKILFSVSKKIESSNGNSEVEEFISDQFLYSIQDQKNELIYLKNKDKFFFIDHGRKELLPISLEDKQKEVEKIKDLFPSLEYSKEIEGSRRKIIIEGKGNSATLNGQVEIEKVQYIENSVNNAAQKLLNTTSLIDIDLKEDEIARNIIIDLNIQGNKVKSEILISSIEILKDNSTKYDYLLQYSIQ